jgi:cysteinyl-tRNA synthetase
MIRQREAKMAKSVGNIFLLHEALDRWDRDILIMYFLAGHYHQPVEFDQERLEQAAANVRRIREAGRKLSKGPSPDWSDPLRASFFHALAEDFNTARALSEVFAWVAQANRSTHAVGSRDLHDMLSVLGLGNLLEAEAVEVPADVRERAQARERARAAGDYAEADRIRDQLRAQGWDLRDGPDGPELLPIP